MSLYNKHILPHLVHFACSLHSTMQQRGKVVPLARGQVLEVGLGSGLNLPFYDAGKVDKLWGLEPSHELTAKAENRVREAKFDVELIDALGEEIPLEANSIDTVLVTYTLCTIADVDRALREMARVLKPDGKLIFCEHGAAPDQGVRRVQNCLNPLWKCIGGGCHLNREIPWHIEQNGFTIREMETMYIPGWRPVAYNYWGTATPLADS